jgi:hypothetical protein
MTLKELREKKSAEPQVETPKTEDYSEIKAHLAGSWQGSSWEIVTGEIFVKDRKKYVTIRNKVTKVVKDVPYKNYTGPELDPKNMFVTSQLFCFENDEDEVYTDIVLPDSKAAAFYKAEWQWRCMTYGANLELWYASSQPKFETPLFKPNTVKMDWPTFSSVLNKEKERRNLDV